MELSEIKKLQRLQLFLLNIFVILIIAIIYILDFFNVSGQVFFIGLFIIMIITMIFEIQEINVLSLLVPSLKKLRTYEKEKYGHAWKIRTRTKIWGSALVTIFLGLNIYLQSGSTEPFDLFEYDLKGSLLFFLIMLIMVVNFPTIMEQRKIIQATPVELQKHTVNQLIMSIILGMIFALLIINIIISQIS